MKSSIFHLPFAIFLIIATTFVATAPAQNAGVINNTGHGLQLNTRPDQGLSFFGAAQIAQPSGSSQASLTNSTGGTASTTLAAGTGVSTITIPVNLASVGNAAVLTAYKPGYNFKIIAVTFAVNAPVTTASKLATVTPSITGVNLTGGVLSLTSAAATPMGALIAGTSVTAANVGGPTDTITLTASSVTAFIEGSGSVLIEIQNMDTANAAASIANLANALQGPLVNLGLIKGSN